MSGSREAFLGRQPIVGREGELIGYELLYRARATDDSARFDDEHSASLHVLSTLLHDLGAPQVLAGRQAFINVGADVIGLSNHCRAIAQGCGIDTPNVLTGYYGSKRD